MYFTDLSINDVFECNNKLYMKVKIHDFNRNMSGIINEYQMLELETGELYEPSHSRIIRIENNYAKSKLLGLNRS